MNPKLKTIFSFVRAHDTLQYFESWSNNSLRDHIWYSKEENKSLFYYFVKGELLAVIEFYREDDYELLVQKIIKGLSNSKRVKSKRKGGAVFVHGFFMSPKVDTIKVLRRFKSYLKDFDNIYWWKLKTVKNKQQVLLCKLRRK